MAYLIVNERGPETGTTEERWYEFNPDDTELLRKIEALVARGDYRSDAENETLATLCEQSLETERKDVREMITGGWIGMLIGWLPVNGRRPGRSESLRNRRPMYTRANRRSSLGSREELSRV